MEFSVKFSETQKLKQLKATRASMGQALFGMQHFSASHEINGLCEEIAQVDSQIKEIEDSLTFKVVHTSKNGVCSNFTHNLTYIKEWIRSQKQFCSWIWVEENEDLNFGDVPFYVCG